MVSPEIIEYMYYVYVLLSKTDRKFYIGFSEDLRSRIKAHRDGLVESTRPRRPLILIFYEAYITKTDALRREKYFKSSKGKTSLRYMLRDYLKNERKFI